MTGGTTQDDDIRADVAQILVAQHDRFLNFLARRVGSRAIAEDLLQAAFVKALERQEDLRDGESAVAWFYRLLRNALIDFYRHRAVERHALQRQGLEPEITEHDSDLHAEICQCVHGLIPTLKPEYADSLRAVEIEGRTVAAVADQLGINPGNAAVRVHRARQALKRRLETSCGTCTEHACLQCSCRTSANDHTNQ